MKGLRIFPQKRNQLVHKFTRFHFRYLLFPALVVWKILGYRNYPEIYFTNNTKKQRENKKKKIIRFFDCFVDSCKLEVTILKMINFCVLYLFIYFFRPTSLFSSMFFTFFAGINCIIYKVTTLIILVRANQRPRYAFGFNHLLEKYVKDL